MTRGPKAALETLRDRWWTSLERLPEPGPPAQLLLFSTMEAAE